MKKSFAVGLAFGFTPRLLQNLTPPRLDPPSGPAPCGRQPAGRTASGGRSPSPEEGQGVEDGWPRPFGMLSQRRGHRAAR